ncbi:MAG: sulfatase-like hydrolase/transferase [bacterium]|nr:sulfatase-like hydrolase/transferase [bacterium]
MPPYNFLLIMTDQHRADHLSCYGNPVLATPNLDRIAANGLRFERFYVSNPVCMPNRATLMTGRLPSNHGVRYNGVPLHPRSNTFVHLLRNAGYRTALAGKSHLQNMGVGPAILRKTPPPWPVQGTLAEGFAESMLHDERLRTDIELIARWRDQGEVAIPQPYYGFDDVKLTIGHGDFVRGHYQTWLAEHHPAPHTLRGAKHALPAERPLSISQAWRTQVPEELYPTTYITDQTVKYLKRYATTDSEAPFFLFCSFPDPHHPFVPPGRYFDRYTPNDIPVSPVWNNPHQHTPPHVQALVKELGTPEAVRHTPVAFAVDAEQTREAIALTYGMISMIDDGVGRILDTLEQQGLANHTVVLFTSDHGDLMGDHQLMLKGPYHFQGLIRVPMLLNVPGRTNGSVTSALASTVDLAQTILHLAGLEPYHGMQGQSLVSLLDNPATSVHDDILIEDDGQRLLKGTNRPIRLRTLLTPEWRLTYYDGFEFGELYNLIDDPLEHHNLWHTPATQTVQAALTDRLLRTIIDQQNRSPLPTFTA